MIIIVPQADDGLQALVKGLSQYTIEGIRKKMYYSQMELYLPKFKIESTLLLNEPLKQVTSFH